MQSTEISCVYNRYLGVWVKVYSNSQGPRSSESFNKEDKEGENKYLPIILKWYRLGIQLCLLKMGDILASARDTFSKMLEESQVPFYRLI